MNIPKIKPRAKQILVKPEEEESRESEYGIITPTNVEQEKKSIGTVIAVGAQISDITEGDKVIFGTYAGENLKFKDSLNEVDYKLLHDEEVLAIIEESESESK